MTDFDSVVMWGFVAVNTVRTLAYVPQIWSAARRPEGAHAISTITWGYFALSHLTGALYSDRIAHDAKLTSSFLGNFLACAALLAVVWWQRVGRKPVRSSRIA